jgi:hypothetical protein
MRVLCLIILIVFSSCASFRISKPAEKKQFKKERFSKLSEDERLKVLIKRPISRKGKFSTVSEDFITTEKYVRKNSETILTLEKGELRIETEKNNSGRTITKTYQDGILTSFTITRPEKSILVLFDRDGDFVHKVVTKDDNELPECYQYTGKSVITLTESECVGLIPGFED